MGNKPFIMTKETHIIGYESVDSKKYTLITTLNDCDCFIKNTLTPKEEVNFINECILAIFWTKYRNL